MGFGESRHRSTDAQDVIYEIDLTGFRQVQNL